MTPIFKISEIINLPLSMVWSFASDLRNAPGWLFDITEIENFSVGNISEKESTWIAKTRDGGKANNTKLKIIKFDEQYRFEILSKSNNIERCYSYSFAEDNNATLIKLNANYMNKNLASKFTCWVNTLPYIGKERKQLSDLKQLMMQLRT